MKRILSLLLAAVMVLSMGISAFAVEGDYTGKTVILHTNDVHGKIQDYAKVAALVDEFEAAGAEVILTDAGDYSQGTVYVSMSKGADAVTMMNAAGYDIAILGNHEFDYGWAQIKANLESADFEVLCANVLENDAPIYDGYTIVEKGGVKVGFFGLETPEAQTKTNPALIKGLDFLAEDELFACANEQVAALEAEGADVIICLSHLGIDASSEPNRSYDLWENTTGIDLIIDGHSHSVMTEGANGEPIQSTGTALANVGVVVIDNATKAIEDNFLFSLADYAGSDEAVAAAAKAIIDPIDAKYGEVFAESKVDLNGAKAPNGNRDSETNLGDLITDSMVWKVFQNKDGLEVPEENIVAITNGGGIRAPIAKGDVTMKDVNTVLPFGNTIALVYVTGEELLEALEASTFCTPESVGGFPQVAGIEFEVHTYEEYDANPETYPGSTYYGPASINRVVINSINGKEFDPAAVYGVISNNFCAAGGDTYYAFAAASGQFDTGIPLDEALIEYITEELNGVIDERYAAPQGRITIYNSYADASAEAVEELKATYTAPAVLEDGWNPYVKEAIDDFIATYGGTEDAYVVFDFDNTTSIFDVEEQLAVYQLQVMAFAFTPEEMPAILATELGDLNVDRSDLGYGNGSYNDWIDDITAAYTYLYNTYGPFDADGLDEAAQAEIQADPMWAEFATKMRAMYDLVYDAESPAVAYPWVLYWFTGMTEQEVYELAYASHSHYGAVESEYVEWTTAGEGTKVGAVSYEWTSGTGVSKEVQWLYKALDEAGIDVWVCSASAIDPIRAAIDAFGLHDYVTGVIAMARTLEDGKYVNSYDYETGYGWRVIDGEWVKDNIALGAQTQGVGKVQAINNAIVPLYGVGPLAGFMDSTGDYNFCTEYDTLKLVVNFNRASRKVTDGGGVIAELAIYQRDYLGYDSLATANAAGDTYYVLQGRQENGHRGLLASDYTLRLGKSAGLLFREDKNFTQLQYMIDNEMTTEEVINTFAVKTSADDSVLGFKYGFVAEYAGYKNIKDLADAELTYSEKHDEEIAALKDKYTAPAVLEDGWNPYVKEAIDDFIATYGGTKNAYVVFDFDNTTSIFDVEEQLAVYQLQVMAFAFTPEEMPEILATELGDLNADRSDLGYGNGSYNDWIADITDAYTYLYENYGPFDADGLDEAAQAEIQADPMWLEFATKMRTMYDVVYDAESPAVAYPWVLYWFTGMTEQEVYDLAYASHTHYGAVESEYITWTTPGEGTRVGEVSYEWTSGTGVSKEVQWLYKALDQAGIDVWVCSASAIDPIRAAIDAFGLHDYVTGVIAMARCMDEEGRYINAYDYETGYGWRIIHGRWVKDNLALGAQTQGVGKVQAINNAIVPHYNGVGPLAGFMDSTGDYNFCTEYDNLKLVVNFNRASRKVTDGGGVIAELAIYQRDYLGYTDLATANAAGDTYYVIQGRQENGHRGLLASDYTLRLGKTSGLLFRNDDNFAQLFYMIDNEMTTEEVINMFAVKTSADDSVLDFKYGFVSNYAGYKNIENEEKEVHVHDWSEWIEKDGYKYRFCLDCHLERVVYTEKVEDETNPGTGAPVVFPFIAIIAAAAVCFKK